MTLGKNYQSLILAGMAIAACAFLVHAALRSSAFSAFSSSSTGTATVSFDAYTTVIVDVADTEQARQKGLSGNPGLVPGRGMLFIFDKDDAWGMWMKDMHFSIDILWIDAGGQVVSIQRNVAPESYPTVFRPSSSARYVLEVPAGFSTANNINEGSTMTFGTSSSQ